MANNKWFIWEREAAIYPSAYWIAADLKPMKDSLGFCFPDNNALFENNYIYFKIPMKSIVESGKRALHKPCIVGTFSAGSVPNLANRSG